MNKREDFLKLLLSAALLCSFASDADAAQRGTGHNVKKQEILARKQALRRIAEDAPKLDAGTLPPPQPAANPQPAGADAAEVARRAEAGAVPPPPLPSKEEIECSIRDISGIEVADPKLYTAISSLGELLLNNDFGESYSSCYNTFRALIERAQKALLPK